MAKELIRDVICEELDILPICPRLRHKAHTAAGDHEPSASTAARRVVGTEIVAGGEPGQDVLQFLISVSYLLERFRVAGITDQARLVTVAKWSVAEKEAFLGNKMQLNASGLTMVLGGLAKLVRVEA
ncbi:hypothetical protein BC628DRAFT_1417102 [Trametes gibbosa]|nr:hypothetical protein BC628DRAFT_1417102 [Trametes gibbosa]